MRSLKPFVSIKCGVVLLAAVITLNINGAWGQLDLPAMPGPPYPDPRGQNRWGVKFDPRLHGPPFDKTQGGSSNQNAYQRPHQDSRGAHAAYHPNLGRFRNNFRNHHNYHGFNINNRHASQLAQYSSNEGNLHAQPLQQQFWNAWNAQYKSIIQNKPSAIRPASALDDSYSPLKSTKDKDGDANSYWNRIRGFIKDKMVGSTKTGTSISNKGESQSSLFKYSLDFDSHNKKQTQHQYYRSKPKGGKHRQKGQKNWPIFTTLGRGLDAVNGGVWKGVKSVVKGSSGPIIKTGVKLGTKVAKQAAFIYINHKLISKLGGIITSQVSRHLPSSISLDARK